MGLMKEDLTEYLAEERRAEREDRLWQVGILVVFAVLMLGRCLG
jgi:hypothetical protein